MMHGLADFKFVKAYIWPNLKISEKHVCGADLCIGVTNLDQETDCTVFLYLTSCCRHVPSKQISIYIYIYIYIHPRTVRIHACSSNHFLIFHFIPDILSQCLDRGDYAKIHLALTNKFHFSNQCFISILPACYMFRTSYFHCQEDHTVHATLYAMFLMHFCKESRRMEDVLDTGWLTLHNGLSLHNCTTMYRKHKIHLAL